MRPLPDLRRGLDGEIASEKAGSLARAGERLEAMLAALRAFDAATPTPPPASAPTELTIAAAHRRDELVAEAAEALWYLLVQRDAIGPTRHEQIFAIYAVPADVRARIGPRR